MEWNSIEPTWNEQLRSAQVTKMEKPENTQNRNWSEKQSGSFLEIFEIILAAHNTEQQKEFKL